MGEGGGGAHNGKLRYLIEQRGVGGRAKWMMKGWDGGHNG